mmetsp:Transcript_9926/g.31084  ORF Transcript_9926/g.31084 Transcript_9926/m.31084 type:complete len:228 (+) Transcript_9926:1167-1850(+)
MPLSSPSRPSSLARSSSIRRRYRSSLSSRSMSSTLLSCVLAADNMLRSASSAENGRPSSPLSPRRSGALARTPNRRHTSLHMSRSAATSLAAPAAVLAPGPSARSETANAALCALASRSKSVGLDAASPATVPMASTMSAIRRLKSVAAVRARSREASSSASAACGSACLQEPTTDRMSPMLRATSGSQCAPASPPSSAPASPPEPRSTPPPASASSSAHAMAKRGL